MEWCPECRRLDDERIGPEKADARRAWRKAYWMANNKLPDDGPFWRNGWWVFPRRRYSFQRVRHSKLLEMTEVLERRVAGAETV